MPHLPAATLIKGIQYENIYNSSDGSALWPVCGHRIGSHSRIFEPPWHGQLHVVGEPNQVENYDVAVRIDAPQFVGLSVDKVTFHVAEADGVGDFKICARKRLRSTTR